MTTWRFCIDLSAFWPDDENDITDIPEFASTVVAQIRASDAFQSASEVEQDDVDVTLEALGSSRTLDEFDAEMDWLYDWADKRKIWIETQDPNVFKRIASTQLTGILTATEAP